MTGRQVHRAGTLVLSLLMVAIGVALIVQARRRRTGACSRRACCSACCSSRRASARLYLETRSGAADMSAERRAAPAEAGDGSRGGGAERERRARPSARAAELGGALARDRCGAASARRSCSRSSTRRWRAPSTSRSGSIAGHALGLTPLVFLIAALLFALTAMTYVEGASLHQERGGSTVFARYAFNELVSFVAGWAILLDYVILIAVTAFSATQYLQRLLASARRLAPRRCVLALAFIALVVLGNIRGFSRRRARRDRRCSSSATWRCRLLIVVLGLVAVLQPAHAARPDPPRQRADVVGPGLRADGRGDRLHEPRVGRRARGRGADQPRRAASAWSRAARRRSCSCTWASRSWP